jgi:hypothetical protein
MDDQKPASSKPEPIFPTPDLVPEELRGLKRWVGFRYKWNGHKWKKPPHSPLDGHAIGATPEHRDHFLTYDEALAGAIRNRLDGVGFVLEDGDAGVDFDNCVKGGVIDPDVVAWLKNWFPSYAEFSVSGTGIHVLGKAKLAATLAGTPIREDENSPMVEAYDHGRFFTFSGKRLPNHPLKSADCQAGFDKLLQNFGVKKSKVEGKKSSGRPLSRSLIRKLHFDNLAALRTALEGQGNATLNTTAFFAAKAYQAGALDMTEEQIKDEMFKIVTQEWRHPHDEHGARSTIDSGWTGGLESEPLNVTNKESILFVPGTLETALPGAESVLHAMGLKYFERNRELVHTVYGRETKESKYYKRDEESIVLAQASHQTIISDLDKNAQFYIGIDEKTSEPKVIHVPSTIPAHLHDRVATKPREVPYPTLNMVTSSPVLLPSGQVSQGVFEDGVLFIPRVRSMYAPVVDRPSRADALKALAKFDAVFGKFPFVDPGQERPWNQTASYSVVLAGVFSLVARPYLGFGPTPLFTFNAPSPRSGKSKLPKAICAAGLGHLPTTVHYKDEIEFGKHLLPLMRSGDRAILLDNLELTLTSTKLNILITECAMRDRILGESDDVSLTNVAVLFATGNNLAIGGDLTVRTLRCDIDPMVEHPEARKFDFEPVALAREKHPQLVTAACTALRAYILEGMKWGLRRNAWGGFEDWDRLVSGCLTWLGYADPYETRDRVMEDDPIRAANSELLDLWYQRYKERSVSLNEIRAEEGEIYEMLLKDHNWNGYHARFVLNRLVGKIVNGLRLVRLDGRSRFQVVKLNGQPSLDFSRNARSQE